MPQRTATTEEKFNELLCYMDEAKVLSLRNNAEINNVVTGLDRHCFGVGCNDNNIPFPYTVFYVNGETKLEGYFINLSTDTHEKDELLFLFTRFLSTMYNDIDPVDMFNSIQHRVRSMFEMFQIFTVTSNFIERLSAFNSYSIVAPQFKKIVTVSFIDKMKFYKSLFGDKDFNLIQSGTDHIYLMLNSRNNLIKIGKSNKPTYRERTLQSQEPEIHLIAYWVAPANVEKQLHKEFIGKKIRGEWYKLGFNELEKIRLLMSIYES